MLTGIELLQVIEHLANLGGIGLGRSGCVSPQIGERHPQRVPTTLEAPARPLIIDQGPLHHLRNECKEVTTVGKLRPVRQQFQERLVDQRCGLQGDSIESVEALAQLPAGHLFEFVVGQRHDLLEGRFITSGRDFEEAGDLPLVVHLTPVAAAMEKG